jgi:hypothetical protein
MSRERYVRFCEGPGVKFPRATFPRSCCELEKAQRSPESAVVCIVAYNPRHDVIDAGHQARWI